MKDIFTEAGITIGQSNKKQIDQTIHKIMGISYKDCSTTWKVVKQNYLSDELKRGELIQKLKTFVK
jgi:hypothetical protein